MALAGSTVLDVGAGIELSGWSCWRRGLPPSQAWMRRARMSPWPHEIERLRLSGRATFHLGDFVALAQQFEPADIVTLHRVVCCYGDWTALVDASAARARRLYGLVYPNDRWWTRLAIRCGNLVPRLRGQSFRGYVRFPGAPIDERIRAAGFQRRLHHRGWLWQTLVYERVGHDYLPSRGWRARDAGDQSRSAHEEDRHECRTHLSSAMPRGAASADAVRGSGHPEHSEHSACTLQPRHRASPRRGCSKKP